MPFQVLNIATFILDSGIGQKTAGAPNLQIKSLTASGTFLLAVKEGDNSWVPVGKCYMRIPHEVKQSLHKSSPLITDEA